MGYVEDAFEERTPLAAFFSILLKAREGDATYACEGQPKNFYLTHNLLQKTAESRLF
jgi:hypothetical protein